MSSFIFVATLFGFVAGSVIVFASPRIVAHRLETPPEPAPPLVLVPLVGGYLAHFRPLLSLLVSLAMGIVLGLLARSTGPGREFYIEAAYSILLVQIAAIDLDYRLVLNRLTYPGIAAAVALSPLLPGVGLYSALLGAGVAFLLFTVIELLGRGAMGPGDTKLVTLIGAMRGFPAVFNAVLIGVLFGGVAALILLIVFRRGRKETFAYGPYLAIGGLAAFVLFAAG